jgi:hypothetical protein
MGAFAGGGKRSLDTYQTQLQSEIVNDDSQSEQFRDLFKLLDDLKDLIKSMSEQKHAKNPFYKNKLERRTIK